MAKQSFEYWHGIEEELHSGSAEPQPVATDVLRVIGVNYVGEPEVTEVVVHEVSQTRLELPG